MVAAWRPDITVQVAFSTNPNDTTPPTWSDLSSLWTGASSCKRGRQYELDQNQAAQPTMVWLDPNEYLNPANTGSPYYPGVRPLRQILWQAAYPNPVAGNLLNSNQPPSGILGVGDAGYDPSFESYTVSTTVPWITAVGGTSPLVGTSTPHTGTKDLTYTVVGSATVQGVSWVVPCQPGRQYTTSVYVRQSSASTQHVYVDTTSGTTTTTTGAYVRLTVAFTATQPTHVIAVKTSGTAIAGTVLIDDVQHEAGASASTFTTTGSTIYGVFRGFVERWPSLWDNQGFLGRCESTSVDAFEPLNLYTLNTDYYAEVISLTPAYFWPLNEMSGSTSFGDQSGMNRPSLVEYSNTIYGPTAISAGAPITIVGDRDAAGVGFTPADPPATGGALTIIAAGTRPRTSSILFPATFGSAWGATVAVWVQVEQSAVPQSPATPIAQANGSVIYPVQISIGDVGTGIEVLYSNVDASGNNFTLAATSTLAVDDGMPHLLIGTVAQDTAANTTLTLYVDGKQITTNTATTASLGGKLYTQTNNVQVGGIYIGSFSGFICNGTVSNVAMWDRTLTAPELAALWTSGGLGNAGETSGTRVRRYVNAQAFFPLQDIDVGSSLMGPSTATTGQSVLQACQDVTVTEQGNFWIDKDGTVTFAGRSERYLATTSLYVFGENIAAGEFPYQEEIGYDFDPTFVYNSVTVSNSDGVTVTVTDSASRAEYFPRSVPLAANTYTDDAAIQLGYWTLNTHKQPSQRVEAISLHPASYPALWPVVLGLEVNDRVTVKRRPSAANNGAGIVMSADFFVESISHDSIDMAAGTWVTTLLLSPADLSSGVFILDDPVWGLLDGPGLIAY